MIKYFVTLITIVIGILYTKEELKEIYDVITETEFIEWHDYQTKLFRKKAVG